MDEDEEAKVRAVFDDHANPVSNEGAFIHHALVMKALRELGLTPSEATLKDLISKGDGVVDYNKFKRFYTILKKEVVTMDQIKQALAAFDTDGSGNMSRQELKDSLLLYGEGLTLSELDAILPDNECDAVCLDDLSADLFQRHDEAVVPMPPREEPEPQEVKDAKATVFNLRSLRHDEAAHRKAGYPPLTRLNDIADLSQEWLKDSHVTFMSFDGPGDAPDRLLELSEAMAEIPEEYAEKAGFYKVTFRRADESCGPINMCLSHEDFTIADTKRLISDALSLCINNIVFTLKIGDDLHLITGYPLERGGGSFLSQLFAAYTKATGEDNPTSLEVTVFRQPDIMQYKCSSTGMAITNTLLNDSLCGKKDTITRVVGQPGNDSSDEGHFLVFADKADMPGVSRSTDQNTGVTVEMARVKTKNASKPLIVVRVTAKSPEKDFPFRCGLIMDCSSWNLKNEGQPLSLYEWKTAGNMWCGFSQRSTPVMLDIKSGRIARIFVEFHSTGLYYISHSEIELVIDEGRLDGRINKKFEGDGKPKVTGGRPHIRPWGWTRKGLQLTPWKVITGPAITYHGSEFELAEWMLAPRKSSKQKKISNDRTAGRTVEREREEWRPPGKGSMEWEQWSDGAKSGEALFFSPSLQFSVHRSYYQYYSLALSCDVEEISSEVDQANWVLVPPHPDGSPIVRITVMCYTDADQITDVAHPFRHVLPTVDTDFRSQPLMEYRVPATRCRPVGLLLRKFSEPPEFKIRSMVPTWMDKAADVQPREGGTVMVRNTTEEEWKRGVVRSYANDIAHVSVAGGNPQTYAYIRTDFDQSGANTVQAYASPATTNAASVRSNNLPNAEPVAAAEPEVATTGATPAYTPTHSEAPTRSATPEPVATIDEPIRKARNEPIKDPTPPPTPISREPAALPPTKPKEAKTEGCSCCTLM
eukprot:TRINITY_DN1044_c0_g2_i1.p1 TRINITY_DN1044_c0_g2~~TRINITY_DN1044_c0_g2_i1.p1  ORF type:complete len:940 (+),score=234.88 TRINITY_DN1044_c0_g2_i1:37-2820(+)